MSNLPREEMTAATVPDLVWRAQISGLLRDLTRELLALTEVVLAMNEKLASKEETNRESE